MKLKLFYPYYISSMHNWENMFTSPEKSKCTRQELWIKSEEQREDKAQGTSFD